MDRSMHVGVVCCLSGDLNYFDQNFPRPCIVDHGPRSARARSLTGQHNLATALWERSNTPLRAAIMASQLCRRLSRHSSLRADSEALLAQSLSYEDLALELLDAVRDSKLAVQLLCHIQWDFICEGEAGDHRTK
eukprot:6625859-Prymnesium_polylepis.2